MGCGASAQPAVGIVPSGPNGPSTAWEAPIFRLVDQHPPWVFLSHDASMRRFRYIYRSMKTIKIHHSSIGKYTVRPMDTHMKPMGMVINSSTLGGYRAPL